MLDAKRILDQFLGSGSAGSGGGGLGGAVGGALSQLGGGGRQPAPQQNQPGAPQAGGGGGGDLMKTIEGFAKGPLGGVAGGAIAGSLASILLGKGKKSMPLGGSAVKLGGLAILGGLAYKAWQNYQDKQQTPGSAPPPPPMPQAGPVQIQPPPADSSFTPSTSGEEQTLGLLLIRSMIAAARADGQIDKDEIAKIREALKAAGAEADEQNFLLESLGRPDDLDAIAREARGPELASEIWLAARLTIDPDTPAEQAFLKNFAEKLGLDAPLAAHLEATAAQAKQSGVEAG